MHERCNALLEGPQSIEYSWLWTSVTMPNNHCKCGPRRDSRMSWQRNFLFQIRLHQSSCKRGKIKNHTCCWVEAAPETLHCKLRKRHLDEVHSFVPAAEAGGRLLAVSELGSTTQSRMHARRSTTGDCIHSIEYRGDSRALRALVPCRANKVPI
jgi:hypothetical protein